MSPKAAQLWLAGSLLLGVVLAPFIASGNSTTRSLQEAHARRIASMSVSERNRLEQNEAQYKAATPRQKEALNALHSQLEKDRLSGNGELTAVMLRYDEWLKTIKPFQREQLSNLPDPKARIALMKEIVLQEREITTRRNMRLSDSAADRPGWDYAPVLDDQALAVVMQALLKAADPRLTPEQRDHLKDLQGLKRDVRLLQILKEYQSGITPKPFMEAQPPEFKIVSEQIGNLIEDAAIREFMETGTLKSSTSPRGPVPPELRLPVLLSRSLMTELFRQRRSAHRSTDSGTLERFLETLPAERQYELLALEASDFQTVLKNQYLDVEGLKDLPRLQDLGELFGRPGGMRGDRRPFEGGPDRGSMGPGGPREGRFRGPPGDRGPPGEPRGRRDDLPAGPPPPPATQSSESSAQ